MPKFERWDFDYKPKKGDTTGPNLIVKALPGLSFYDADSDCKISRKRMPTDLRGVAKLNPVEQAHIIALTFDSKKNKLHYNRTANQYGAAI